MKSVWKRNIESYTWAKGWRNQIIQTVYT